MMKDKNFVSSMNSKLKPAWISFQKIIEKFLGYHKIGEYKKILADVVSKFGNMGCLMNLKLQLLFSHLRHFPMNSEVDCEEQEEQFHQDIKDMERRYQ